MDSFNEHKNPKPKEQTVQIQFNQKITEIMADEPIIIEQTFKEKLLFYTTAFFVLLGIFSLFAFLFLVPFVIEPAFTTIFMEFDETPASCITVEVEHFKGASNCSWTSCREGCTKEVYECTQIRVNYKVNEPLIDLNSTDYDNEMAVIELEDGSVVSQSTKRRPPTGEHLLRIERGIREYEYVDSYDQIHRESHKGADGLEFMEYIDAQDGLGSGEQISGNSSEWFFTGAKLFPNVKGCGYPPMLNCSIWTKQYTTIGTNFSCYYSRVDPGLVIDHLDMEQNSLNLIYAMAIPIPSFIVSVIYLTFAYFKIYNEDEESAPLGENAEEIAGNGAAGGTEANGVIVNGTATITVASAPITPTSNEVPSFGAQLKIKMADEMSRDTLDGGFISNSGSIQG